MFTIGQKVVCVDDSNLKGVGDIEKDKIYIIIDIVEAKYGTSLLLNGVNNGSISGYPYFYGYNPKRFRPIDSMWVETLLEEISKEIKEAQTVKINL